MTLLDLATRCEQATGPDRELDRQIEMADTYGPTAPLLLQYTASLDAAMTLVPDGTIWEVGHKVHYPRASGDSDRANYAFVNVGRPGGVKSFNGKSVATPALALCAAALRARAGAKA